MNEKRENILNIQYHVQKGLTLSWSLGGLLNKGTYFRHLFIFLFDNQTFFESILNQICSKIKIGDFIALLSKRNLEFSKQLNWFQKTSLSLDSRKFKTIQQVSVKQLLLKLPMIGRQIAGLSNPVIFNIFTDRIDEIPKIKQVIKRSRIDGLFSYHVNFFADFTYHNISTNMGFNEINSNEQTVTEVGRIYKSLSFQSCVTNIQMEVSCPTVQLTTRKDSIWQNVDFGRIRRYYYGPSIHYTHDCLCFVDEAMSKNEGNIPMIISLKITLFSGKVLTAEKSFILTIENIRQNRMTKCDGNEPRSTYEYSKLIRSKTQPFCSNSSVVITKFIAQGEEI